MQIENPVSNPIPAFLVGSGGATPGEAHLGQVGGHTRLTDFTLSLDTNAYTAGDLLADTQSIAGAFRKDDGTGVLMSLTLLDEDDQAAAAMTVYILTAATSLGTENAAFAPTDANARLIIGVVSIASGDWVDLVNSRIVHKTNLNIPVQSVAGTDDLALAVVTAGTPTQTAAGITGWVGILCD